MENHYQKLWRICLQKSNFKSSLFSLVFFFEFVVKKTSRAYLKLKIKTTHTNPYAILFPYVTLLNRTQSTSCFAFPIQQILCPPFAFAQLIVVHAQRHCLAPAASTVLLVKQTTKNPSTLMRSFRCRRAHGSLGLACIVKWFVVIILILPRLRSYLHSSLRTLEVWRSSLLHFANTHTHMHRLAA